MIACTTAPGQEPGEPTDGASLEFEILWARYEELEPPKAFAYAFDGDGWAWGVVDRARDPADARDRAIATCEDYRIREGVRGRCRLYAWDAEVVWSVWDALAEFRAYPGHKVFWLAGDPEQHVFDSVFDAASREAAVQAAMADCREAAAPYALAHSCRACQIDDGVACVDLEAGWERP